MDVLILLVFVGLVLVCAAFIGFAWTVRAGSLDHSDRLSLLPLESDITDVGGDGTPCEREGRQTWKPNA